MTDIAKIVKEIVAEHMMVEESKVVDEASFLDDLEADSLDTVELVLSFEERFDIEIPDDDMDGITTVGDAIKLIERLKAA